MLGERRRRSVIVKLLELAIALSVLLLPATALALTRASVVENASALAARNAKTRVRGFELAPAKIASGFELSSARNASGKSARERGEGVRVHHRNRVWSPDLAAFLSPDEFIYHRGTGTLWSWPGQNPIRWRDPSGRDQGSGDAIGESMMLQREDLSSDQMQSISVYRGAGVFAEFAALFAALGGVAAAEAGAAATLQRGLISNQGSLRMLAKLAASAISGARACGDPGYSGGSSGGSGRTASTPLGKSIESLKQTLGGGGGPWKLLTAHAESATSPAKRLQGATSMEEIFVNQDTGERLVRHTIFKDGEILHETFRPFAKFGSE